MRHPSSLYIADLLFTTLFLKGRYDRFCDSRRVGLTFALRMAHGTVFAVVGQRSRPERAESTIEPRCVPKGCGRELDLIIRVRERRPLSRTERRRRCRPGDNQPRSARLNSCRQESSAAATGESAGKASDLVPTLFVATNLYSAAIESQQQRSGRWSFLANSVDRSADPEGLVDARPS